MINLLNLKGKVQTKRLREKPLDKASCEGTTYQKEKGCGGTVEDAKMRDQVAWIRYHGFVI